MTQTKATKFASKESILRSYRQAEVKLDGAEILHIRYKAPSTRKILKMQELGEAAKNGKDKEAVLKSWNNLADLVSEHLVDEQGAPLCTSEELMGAPLDVLLALGQAITPKLKGAAADEVAVQGEG